MKIGWCLGMDYFIERIGSRSFILMRRYRICRIEILRIKDINILLNNNLLW